MPTREELNESINAKIAKSSSSDRITDTEHRAVNQEMLDYVDQQDQALQDQIDGLEEGATGPQGPTGATGAAGTNGWSPIFAVVSDGARRVLQVTDWTGGTGTEPASPRYIGASGLTTVLADAIDIRGAEGSGGGGGSAAWGDITGTITDQTDLTARINALIAAVVDSAPGALDTLNELAAALGDDANFAATVTTALAGKAPLSHTHNASDVSAGTLDGDRLPALSTTKRGGVPATSTPSGKYLRDDGTWATPAGGGGPAQIIYVSQIPGINQDSDLTTGGGTSDQTLIQAVLDTADAYPALELIQDGLSLISGLVAKSNTTIRCLNQSCGFYLANGSNQVMIRNENPTKVPGSKVDKNIKVIGGYWNGNGANNDNAGTQVSADDNLIAGLGFYGVDGITVDDVHIHDSCAWGIVFSNCTKIRSNRCTETVVYPVTGNIRLQQDLISVRGNCSDFYISAGSSQSPDDIIELNSIDYNAPGCAYVGGGPIVNGTIESLHFDNSNLGLGIYSKSYLVDKIRIKGLHGKVQQRALVFSCDPANTGIQTETGNGNIGSVIIDGMDVEWIALLPSTLDLSALSPYLVNEMINVECDIRNLIISNWKITGKGAEKPDFRIRAGFSIGQLTINNYDRFDIVDVALPEIRFKIFGTINLLSFNNVNWSRPTTFSNPSGSFCDLQGTVGAVRVNGLTLYQGFTCLALQAGVTSIILLNNVAMYACDAGAGVVYSASGLAAYPYVRISNFIGPNVLTGPGASSITDKGGDANP